jgi:triosephosphate isomerase
MPRLPLIAGNWKMNKTVPEALSHVEALKPRVAGLAGVEIAVCPPATALFAVGQALADTSIALGAQDLFWEKEGAFTGMISPGMVRDAGCKYVLLGHSERRGRFGKEDPSLSSDLARVFGDTDASVNRKLRAALDHELIPIVCVGETLAEREGGKTDELISQQVLKALEGFTPEEVAAMVLAYEPVWAIGTGKTCDAREANRVIGLIRRTAAKRFGENAASSVRILYGGSVTERNTGELIAEPEIDGALVGGASLEAARFALICQAATAVANAVRHGAS